ncbi:hypothetical protein D9758_007245 [Tetrapyrgos nigripes]|uniref:Carbohydrate-binding module family 19 domain-containing protein n=1 Tax=Tetrapyrgos nigripes TaxID=182062 RepID=A0A8H5D2I3_9AGAR|nr:hypothetical protein D9758_007245 [Tetrapyrgos nigripes]
MVHFTTALFLTALVASSANAAPLNKRIAQVIADSTGKWEQACLSAGGGLQCNPVSVAAFTTLLAAAGPCDQQDNADAMIDLAKTLNNDPTMISLAQIFSQQPRNTPTSQSVPYCQKAPKNPELNGLFQCQFQGADPKTFVGGVAVGGEGTIPFGLNAPLNPAGSCKANPDGPIADGTQLVDLTQDPGVKTNSGGSNPSSPSSSATSSPAVHTSASGSKGASASTSTNSPTSSSSSGSSGFKLQNGKDAQALNAQFASLAADSSCNAGENACVDGGFAQCVGDSFVITRCAGGLTCAALPLVNSAGTSITCTTTADAEARIAASGATGGLTGSGATSSTGSSSSSSSSSSSDATTSNSSSGTASSPATNNAASSPSNSGDFKLQNGLDAQGLNEEFASLTADSSCEEGENACVNGGFAQCVGGSFVITKCAAGLTCAALPLVNSPGTSIACTTTADAEARIAASGATGGLTGCS